MLYLYSAISSEPIGALQEMFKILQMLFISYIKLKRI